MFKWRDQLFLGAILVMASQACFATLLYPYQFTSHELHWTRPLDYGPADLALRLQMIERAQHSIDLETYIFEPDFIGKVFVQALVKKAQQMRLQGQPFRIRFLVDYMGWVGSPQLTRTMADRLGDLGIEVRYFNADPLYNVRAWDFRDHRKVFVVDGNEVMVGGRNISADYFDLHGEWNFLDRDVWVRGPIAKAADDTFNAFWNSSYSVSPDSVTTRIAYTLDGLLLHMQSSKDEETEATNLLADDPQVDQRLERVRKLGADELARVPAIPSHNVTIVSDVPGLFLNSHLTSDDFFLRLFQAKKSVIMENYTFIPTEAGVTALDLLMNRVHMELLTNGVDSIGSGTDEWNLTYPRQVHATNHGMVIYNFDGHSLKNDVLADGVYPQTLWILHAKTMIVDGRDTWIGTNNFDPRSDSLNFETAIAVDDNPEFAKVTEAGIRHRMENAYLLTKDGNFVTPDGSTTETLWDLLQKVGAEILVKEY